MLPACSIRACLALLWLLLQMLAAGPALATTDLIVSRAWLADPDGRLDIRDVVERPFSPIEVPLARGYSDAAHWLRLALRAPAQGQQVQLRLMPAQIDEIRLFEPDGAGGWRTRVTGDRHPESPRDVVSLQPGFVVTVNEAQTTVYLRMHTRSLSLLSAVALEPIEAQARERLVDQLQLLALGTMGCLLAWSLHQALVYRDGLSGLLSLSLTAYLLHGVALGGYLRPWLPGLTPDQRDMLTNVAVCFWPFAALLFDAALLRRYGAPRGWSIGIALLLLVFPVELLMMAAGQVRQALELNYYAFVVERWYVVALACSVRGTGQPGLGFARGVVGVLALIASLVMATEAGWLPASNSDLRRIYYTFLFALLFGSLLFLLLRSRAQQRQQTLEQARLQLALSDQALQLEREHHTQAQELARIDALTGLANRRSFLEQAEQRVVAAVATGRPLALLMIDLDHFKALNDSEGHLGGDQALRSVADRLSKALQPQDLIGRIGGEEFAALLDGSEAGQALQTARRLRAAVAGEGEGVLLADGRRVSVSASVGVTELGGRCVDLSALLQEADLALYAAKAQGRDTECLHDESIAAAAGQRARLTHALTHALAAGELSLAFQPVLCARSGAPFGAEALLRWRHPQLGDVPPDRFIEIAEDTGLILPIGAWVLQQACQEAARWPAPLKLSVNLSGRQLHSAGLVDEVREALRQSGLAPQRLELEVTESALAEPGPATAALTALHALGVRLALDDFGTGYSSLAYLRQFPFDRLKIDRSFVQPLRSGGQSTAQGLVRAIVDLARALNLHCTAEGVETAEQQALLRELGCDVLQGFYLARPMAIEGLLAFFATPATAVPAAAAS